jgi:hypothetical protein
LARRASEIEAGEKTSACGLWSASFSAWQR